MTFIVNESSIGTASGRDFATVALWESSLPANFTTGDGRREIGNMFPDSEYTEFNLVFSGQTLDLFSTMLLRGAPGQARPVWKPTTTSMFAIARTGLSSSFGILDIIFDGANITSLVVLYQSTNSAGVANCDFKNSPAIGVDAGGISNCLCFDNAGSGFQTARPFRSAVRNCGAYNNGGRGFQGRAPGNVVNGLAPINSWSFDNTGQDFENLTGSVNTRAGFCFCSDTSFTLGGFTNGSFGFEESKVATAMGFANLAGRDFRLNVGSPLRLAGPPSTILGVIIDRDRKRVIANEEDRMDIGPFQPSHT